MILKIIMQIFATQDTTIRKTLHMNDFWIFLGMGWSHIISLDALDHILFIIVLSAIYRLENWKPILILVTAFTIGHSVTLALSVYDILRIPDTWVEFLIPCTIMATGIFNCTLKNYSFRSFRLNYFIALSFGLIHGMGFANTIRFMLSHNGNIAIPLLSFNIGLEVGQITLISALLLINYIFLTAVRFPQKIWVWSLSAITFYIAFNMAWERFPLQ